MGLQLLPNKDLYLLGSWSYEVVTTSRRYASVPDGDDEAVKGPVPLGDPAGDLPF